MSVEEIHVPSLVYGSKVIVPEVWLSKYVEHRKERQDIPLSAAKYNALMQLPTLAELRHAFFDAVDRTVIKWHKNNEGVYVPDRTDYVSPEYRGSVQAERGYGEWTSTFIEDGKRIIERPEDVVYKHGVWTVEGGKVTPVELPPDGWVLEYDKSTGFPSRTFPNRADAEKVFGGDTSRFKITRIGLRAVFQYSLLNDDGGPFYVIASSKIDARDSDIGGRSCRRHMEYVMSQTEYEALMQLSKEDPQIADILSRVKPRNSSRL